MVSEQIAAAMERVGAVLARRPASGLGADAAASVRWDGGLRTVARGDDGVEIATDMPAELGGQGAAPTPGWLLRAALASCAVTRIAMAAAAAGIVLDRLEARATSRSDTRGLLAMPDADGAPVAAQPGDVRLHVRIGAAGVAAPRLRALVESTSACSPVTAALQAPVPVALDIHVDEAGA